MTNETTKFMVDVRLDLMFGVKVEAEDAERAAQYVSLMSIEEIIQKGEELDAEREIDMSRSIEQLALDNDWDFATYAKAAGILDSLETVGRL